MPQVTTEVAFSCKEVEDLILKSISEKDGNGGGASAKFSWLGDKDDRAIVVKFKRPGTKTSVKP